MAPTEFDNLPFHRSFIRRISLKPNDALTCEIIAGPFESASSLTGEVCRTYEVDFQRLGAFKFNVDANPWLEIISNRCLTSSEFLDGHNKNGRLSEEPVFHYQLILDEGTVDILAAGFSHSVLEEIPFVRKPTTKIPPRA
ncbi:MAG: hypothetical protein ABR568_03845 [Pyrinomonadaceae bacterium]